MKRRTFIKSVSAALAVSSLPVCKSSAPSLRGKIITVLGPIDPSELGPTLPHEHVLVDFIGADKVSKDRYNTEEVYQTMLPYLQKLGEQGVTGFMECTPDYLGRDSELLVRLAKATGMHILTNTGYYKEPYLPRHAFEESPDELAARWISEIKQGIGDTDVKAGFIKIAVFRELLKPMQQKIVRAACRTHNTTGATIACHCGHGPAALQILDILKEESTPPDALIIVHMNSEKDLEFHYKAAERGAWIEYDNIGSWSDERHLELISIMIDRGFGSQLLLSHDRGWYHVGEPGGGTIKPFTHLFDQFKKSALDSGISDNLFDMLTIENPAKAFQIDGV